MKNVIQNITKTIYDWLIILGENINAYRTLSKRNYN
jgi:hypothetical protein